MIQQLTTHFGGLLKIRLVHIHTLYPDIGPLCWCGGRLSQLICRESLSRRTCMLGGGAAGRAACVWTSAQLSYEPTSSPLQARTHILYHVYARSPRTTPCMLSAGVMSMLFSCGMVPEPSPVFSSLTW